MSWHFSQALEAAYSEANCSDGGQSVPLNATSTPGACCSPDKTTLALSPSRCGTMCEPSTESHGEELLTWYRAGFRAKTSALPEKGQGSKAHDPGCGEKWHGLLARYDRDTHSLRIAQCSLFEDLIECSVILPRWGTLQNGGCWELPTPGLRTSEIASGLWPTPTCPNGGRSVKHVTDWRGRTAYHNGKKVQVGLKSAVKIWPTPTVCGNYNRKGLSATSGDGLATAVKQWPTPTAQDTKNNGAPSQMERNTKPLNAEIGGPLNPLWVEWLMGWPLGWTDCAVSGTDKFQQWLHSHGRF